MRSYRDILAFLDIEAGVENSDDDGDEEDFDAPGFISDEPEIDGAEIEGGISITSRDRGNSVLWNNDAESIVNDIMDRYRGCEGSAWKRQHATEQRTYIDGWKSVVAYLPSVTDGDIWKVAVTPGRELVVVATIFNKVLALQIDGVDSAFCREGMPGVVYIEARHYGAVLNLLNGINNVWPRYYKAEGGPIDLVPISERLALLTLDISPVNEVEKAADQWQRFVRIRDRTRYRNQLAIIGSYIMDAREALVLVVPRAAAHELDLFEATQHDEICELVRNARNLQIRQGEKFEVTQGPWKGFKGVVEDTMVNDLNISIRMKGRYSWEDIEVPRSDLTYTGSKGCATTVKAGPYNGLTGRIHEYIGGDMVVVSPDAGEEQTVDVMVSDIQRTVDPGDEVEIMTGSLKGLSGFYVSTDDEAKARIYLPSTPQGRMDLESLYTGDPFRGLQVLIVDHPLRGYEGYIVGSRLVKPVVDGDDEAFEFEVNKLNHITHYTTRISAKYLQEKHHDSESTWQEVAYEYTRGEIFANHWLRNPAMMHKKFQIMVLQTLIDDGSYRTDNMISGYTVVTEAVTPWAERIVVKTGNQNNLRQKDAELRKVIPDNLALKSGERVIVIGTDAAGSTEIKTDRQKAEDNLRGSSTYEDLSGGRLVRVNGPNDS
ncbi:hypothetical protein PLEOSDRAFT_1087470 [Pleurotus ostreatus PC15]|uniref:Chromatin elongation factor SPT5 n=1 Tax=Pleurotus ostreatus (strain PC15) TaxID=1137138 RepID=A0A067N1X1_PLEO1|nr:hypothetical protein PLEOSDRAFT_1087470 [Pleurotus ostreatus PC15]